jgi:tetratricopeptide (TPR) repeat protein
MGKRMRTLSIVLLLFSLLVSAFERNKLWHDDLSLWENVSASSSGKGRAFAFLGIYYVGQGDYASAVNNFSEAIRRTPYKLRLYAELANAYRKLGDFDGEISAYQQGLSLGKDDAPRLRIGLADAFFRQMLLDDALREYEAALLLAPDNAYAHYKVALLSMGAGDYASARSHLQKARSLDRENPVYQQYLDEITSLTDQQEK